MIYGFIQGNERIFNYLEHILNFLIEYIIEYHSQIILEGTVTGIVMLGVLIEQNTLLRKDLSGRSQVV